MRVHPVVFGVSAALILLFVLLGSVWTDDVRQLATAAQGWVTAELGWVYTVAVGVFLLFVLALVVSPLGRIRLGRDDERPRYGFASWFAMLFSAGMGIGLLFYGVAEPILHASAPPLATADPIEAERLAMRITYFHWGLHAWAVYIVVGLSLAFFAYRRGLPLTIRSVFHPLLGERIHGPFGDAVEILAVIGTLFGVATSLGLGVMQINAGLEHLGLLTSSAAHQLGLIAVITAVATVSVVSGVDRGIRRLSELNLVLGLALLVFVLVAGPTGAVLSGLVGDVGRYLVQLPRLTLQPPGDLAWRQSWTLFYLGWWIAWSPFVGMFIARISRGRTVREFILGVLFVPVALTFVWLAVFGHTAMHLDRLADGQISAAVAKDIPTALFVMLEQLPAARFTCLLAALVVMTYFVTSSDSASLVIDIITSNADPHPPVGQRVFWALTEGAVAAVLLLAGGLAALQTASILTALPFTAVLLLMCVSLAVGLLREGRRSRDRGADRG